MSVRVVLEHPAGRWRALTRDPSAARTWWEVCADARGEAAPWSPVWHLHRAPVITDHLPDAQIPERTVRWTHGGMFKPRTLGLPVGYRPHRGRERRLASVSWCDGWAPVAVEGDAGLWTWAAAHRLAAVGRAAGLVVLLVPAGVPCALVDGPGARARRRAARRRARRIVI